MTSSSGSKWLFMAETVFNMRVRSGVSLSPRDLKCCSKRDFSMETETQSHLDCLWSACKVKYFHKGVAGNGEKQEISPWRFREYSDLVLTEICPGDIRRHGRLRDYLTGVQGVCPLSARRAVVQDFRTASDQEYTGNGRRLPVPDIYIVI